MTRRLLCTDLDRTLIPNGPEPLSPEAPALFAALAARAEVSLAYVTGRHLALIENAISEFGLPRPDYAVADVGSTIYICAGEDWEVWSDWSEHIAPDWAGMYADELDALFEDLDGLQLQEPEKQGLYKLSYYAPLDVDSRKLLDRAGERLRRAAVRANLIWSIDPLAGVGLLDVLPAKAGKLAAIRFLMKREGFSKSDTLFAGDSGNDLDVLASDIPSVLVANAEAGIRERLVAKKRGPLHIARGYLGMNGNYAAGILEGAAHFWPETDAWLREIQRNMEN